MQNSGELALIQHVTDLFKCPRNDWVGIGDDAALVAWPLRGDKARLVLTTDSVLESVCFDLNTAHPSEVGKKALNVNLSDLAAMAATPVAALVNLVVRREYRGPKGETADQVALAMMQGIAKAAQANDVTIVGGDTSSWNGPWSITITAIGQEHPKGSALRSGARVGDWLMVTGSLGGSLLGHHLHFTPRWREATLLQESYGVSSMMDLSDGISADLPRLAKASGVGFTVWKSSLPRRILGERGVATIDQALHDGEDFELLFTVRPEIGKALLATGRLGPEGCPVHHIGIATATKGAVLLAASPEDGSPQILENRGYKHSF